MNDALARHIGRRMRHRRRLLELTQADIGHSCGCSFQTIHKYEMGAIQISAAALYALSRVLEVPTTYFFEGFERCHRDSAEGAPDHGAAAA